jgi:putative tributyrin esterase
MPAICPFDKTPLIFYSIFIIMALIDCKFYSEILGMSSSMMVILPQETFSQIGMKSSGSKGKHKTLFLLHGLSDDHTTWTRRTSIERYTAPLGIAVVMPNVHRSFYTDMERGGAYETFIAIELPRIARSFFHLSDKQEDTFIAGLSMGGYGAFKCALRYPRQYQGAASLSGVMDVAGIVDDPQVNIKHELMNIFGSLENISGSKHDLPVLARELKNQGQDIPRLYQCCGEEDSLYDQNRVFYENALGEKIPITWESDPGYDHTWDYWDIKIQRVLHWMFPPVPGEEM